MTTCSPCKHKKRLYVEISILGHRKCTAHYNFILRCAFALTKFYLLIVNREIMEKFYKP